MSGEQHVPAAFDLEAIEAVSRGVSEFDWAIWHDLDHQGFKTVGDAESYAEVLASGEAEDASPIAHVYTPGDAAFIAYMDPRTALALVDEVRRLREVRDRETIARTIATARGMALVWPEDRSAADAVLALFGQEGQR